MDKISPIFHRLSLLIGKDALLEISKKKVIIFGVGGVGSWCAESLIRSGIHDLTIVDSDVICITNLNRQLQTNTENIGNSKVDELKKRLLLINPDANINNINCAYCEESYDDFILSKYDFVIDAIDSLRHKIHLIKACLMEDTTLFSSMGSASKIDPSKIRTTKISKTFNCPLAKRVRRALKQEKVYKDFTCVFSEELPILSKTSTLSKNINDEYDSWRDSKSIINGTIAHIPAIFGFTLASLVINNIINKAD